MVNPSDSEMGIGRERTAGMGWRVAVSIITFFGSMITVVLWLAFFAEDLSVYQNIALVVSILLGFIAIMGATWAPWGIKHGDQWSSQSTQ